jgi:hypothetical protein
VRTIRGCASCCAVNQAKIVPDAGAGMRKSMAWSVLVRRTMLA